MALLPFLRTPSRSGTSASERGVDTAPFLLPPGTPTRSSTPSQQPETPAKTAAPKGDVYPGEEAMNTLLRELFDAIRSEGDSIRFDASIWIHEYDATRKKRAWVEHKEAMSRQDLIKQLVGRLCETPDVTSKAAVGAASTTSVTLTISGFEWLLGYSPTPALIADLESALEQAVLRPTGYPSSSTGHGFARWAGHQYGHWLTPSEIYLDIAIWKKPLIKLVNPDTGRYMYLQTVYWEPPKDDWGWNMSDRETRYVWGWDPKSKGDKKGRAGAHLGFPTTFLGCDFILWITKEEAFLEAVNRSVQGGKPVSRDLEVDGVTRSGAPKFSAYIGTGYGQWVIAT